MNSDEPKSLSRRELDQLIYELTKEINSSHISDEAAGGGAEELLSAEPQQDGKETVFNILSEERAQKMLKSFEQKKRYRRTLISTAVSLIIVVAASIIISAVLMPVIRISGAGMEPVYQDGDILVLWDGSGYSSGQLCCVSWQNKLLVKRIIGIPGDLIDIDGDGNVYVNGAVIEEPYLINKGLGECDIEFPFEVPEGRLFIMGDRRDTSIDSRSTAVGCIEEEAIVGRVLFKIWPLITPKNATALGCLTPH